MSIKDFEKKYNIYFDGCFVYDALLRLSKKLKEIPDDKRDEFIKDFMMLKYS